MIDDTWRCQRYLHVLFSALSGDSLVGPCRRQMGLVEVGELVVAGVMVECQFHDLIIYYLTTGSIER